MTILTKMMVPVRRPNWVRRQRLLDSLYRGLDYKLTLLTAAAGYGKTTLLADFAHDVELPVCWLTLDREDADPAQFITSLVHCFAQRFPGFGASTRSALASGVRVDDVVGVLVNELVESASQLCLLVLDDFHEVDSAEIGAIMDRLLHFLPPHLHVVISSRSVPPIDLIHLTAKQEMTVLPPQALCFTAVETAALVARNHNLSLGSGDAQTLAHRMSGWVTGIVLATQQMTHHLAYQQTLQDGNLEMVYAYLAQEVIGQQPPHIRNFLLQTAVLRWMTVDLCDRLLQRDDAAQILGTLEAQHLFIERIEQGGTRRFRYHPLFHEFLLEQLAQGEPDRLATLQHRAAQLYGEQGAHEEALRLFLATGELEEAAPLMNDLAADLYNTGRHSTLLEWHQRLGDQAPSAPSLQIQVAKVWFVRGDYTRALALLDEIGQTPANAGVLPKVSLQRGFIWYRQGKLEEALESLRPIKDAYPGSGIQAYAYRIIGLCLQRQGKSEAARGHLLQALELYQQLDDPLNQSRVLTDLSSVASSLHCVRERLEFQNRALEIARSRGHSFELIMPLNNVACSSHAAGDLCQANRLYQEALEHADHAGMRRDEAWVLLGQGDLWLDADLPVAAADAYRKAIELARPTGEPFIVEYGWLGLAACARLSGDLEDARHWLHQICTTVSSTGGRYQIERGLVLLAQGRLEAAQTAFILARDESAVKEDWGELALAELCLAETYRQLGENPEARSALERALTADGRCDSHGARFSLHARRYPALLAYARSHGVAPTALDHLYARIQAVEQSIAELLPGPPQPDPTLLIYALGPGRIIRNGIEIAASDWQRTAARSLFFFAIDQSRIRREQACHIFWPDVAENKARSRFYAALHDARQAVGKDRLLFDQEESIYHVSLSEGGFYDVRAFEEKIAAMQALAPGRQKLAGLCEAVALYAGPFLEDIHEDWVLERRRELESLYVQALVDLGDCYYQIGDAVEAESWYRRVLVIDDYREDIHRKVMLSLVLGGRRAEALRQYQICADILSDELGIEPDPATQALAQDIRSNSL